MKKIYEASELPEKEEVYLRKDFLGWRVVKPYRNKDGSFNWNNIVLGGKRNLIILAIIMGVLAILYLGVNEMISNYKVIADNPCEYCQEIQKSLSTINNPEVNISLTLWGDGYGKEK